MSKNYVEYMDKITFHPGYFLMDILEDLNLNQEEFAERIGSTPKTISKLLNAKTPITNDLAYKISIVTGTSVELWENLQNKYDIEVLKINELIELDEESCFLETIKYKYFVDNEFLPVAKHKHDKIKNLRTFLKVSSLSILSSNKLIANFRASNGDFNDKNVINSNVWLQTVLNEASKVEVNKFNEKKLKSYLDEIRSMTIQKPEVFFERLVNILIECGVVLVLMPHLPNSGINGVTKWINKDRVIVGLNDRTYRADTFWFSLFHELKHVLQKKLKKVMINKIKAEKNVSEFEMEADTFAQNFLIPINEYQTLLQTGSFDSISIRMFARKIGIHPGIVVGRLQHDEVIKFNQLNNLREKYKITTI